MGADGSASACATTAARRAERRWPQTARERPAALRLRAFVWAVQGLERNVVVHAAFLNSTLDSDEARQIERELLAGRLVLLYAAPERILTPRFLAMGCRCRHRT